MKKCKIEKLLIDPEGGNEVHYSSFVSFEAGVQGNKNIVVGIINPADEILSQIEEYLKNKFYETGPENLCLFTVSGLMLAYRKASKWVQMNEDLKAILEIPKLKKAVLNELIDESLENLFPKLEKDERQKVVDLILKSAFQILAERIATDINYLDHIEWRDLERILGEALSFIGFQVKVTPPSKDGGKDIIANLDVYNNKYSFIIELKHWRSGKKVDSDHVEKFLRVVINEKRSGGLFLASYGYTDECVERLVSFKQFNLNLGDGNKIYSIFQIYKKKQDGLILSPKDLVAVLTEDSLGTRGV